MNILEKEIQNEIKKGEYKDKIKKNCAWCNKEIPGTGIIYMEMLV